MSQLTIRISSQKTRNTQMGHEVSDVCSRTKNCTPETLEYMVKKAVDLWFWSTTMVDDLILLKCQPSANHCALGQVSSTQFIQNVFLSKIGVWASI